MHKVLAHFLETLIPQRPLVLFLDYDGTLDDFAPTPDDILPNQSVIKILENLVAHPFIFPIILSGRKLSHLQALMPVEGLCLAGTYGLEIQTQTGDQLFQVEYESIRPTINQLKPAWQALLQQEPAFFLEDKGWSLAIHGKMVNPELSKKVLTQAKLEAEAILNKDRFQILIDDHFLEAAPILADKGKAVTYLIQTFKYQNMNYLYIGDDEKDELGMKAVQSLGGHAIKTAQTQVKTVANWYLLNPDHVRNFLISLEAALSPQNGYKK